MYRWTKMVEHPGGRDGGEFEQTHELYISDGHLVYETDFPSCPTNCFADEDQEYYIDVESKEGAIERLESERDQLKEKLTAIEDLLRESKNLQFKIVFGEDE